MKRQKNNSRGLNRALLELLIDLFSQLSVCQNFSGLLNLKKALFLKDFLKDPSPRNRWTLMSLLHRNALNFSAKRGQICPAFIALLSF